MTATSQGSRAMRKTLLTLAAAALAVGAAAAFPVPSQATASIEPETLARARAIRAEVNTRYRLVPGRKLAVTEATTTGVVESLTLVTDWLELPRVVPADNGIYFAICSARATCPYPPRSASWPAAALSWRHPQTSSSWHFPPQNQSGLSSSGTISSPRSARRQRSTSSLHAPRSSTSRFAISSIGLPGRASSFHSPSSRHRVTRSTRCDSPNRETKGIGETSDRAGDRSQEPRTQRPTP